MPTMANQLRAWLSRWPLFLPLHLFTAVLKRIQTFSLGLQGLVRRSGGLFLTGMLTHEHAVHVAVPF